VVILHTYVSPAATNNKKKKQQQQQQQQQITTNLLGSGSLGGHQPRHIADPTLSQAWGTAAAAAAYG
jgi:hypothetical protein